MRLDSEAAARIAAPDHQKLIRAIEVCILSGKPISQVHRSGRAPLEGFRPIKIGLAPSRAALNARIASRVAAMLDRGWLDEVRQLVASGLPENCKPFDFIGYRDLRAHMQGTITLGDAAARIEQATRRYAKRQFTWFRKVPGIHWLEGFGDNEATQAAAAQCLKDELSGMSARASVVNNV
jgi:tRNA dimethylallyltransferase